VYSARLLSLVVVGTINVVLALAVYVRDRRNSANRAFAATVLVSVVWLTLALLSDLPDLSAMAVLLNRLTFASSLVMGVLLVDFTLVFPSGHGRIGVGWYAYLFVGLAGAALTATTPLVVASVAFRSYGTDIAPGIGFMGYAGWMVAGILAMMVVLGRKYREAIGREKAQLKYLFLGVALFTVFGVTLGLLLPSAVGSYAPAVANTFTPLLLVGFTAYAMIRHRLMDMRLVVLRGMLYTILVAVLSVFYFLLAQLVRTRFAENLGINSDVAFVIGGLAAVFLFQPLREVLENFTDHIFYRRRYDQQTLLQRFSAQLVGVVDPAEITAAASKVLAEQIKTSSVTLVHEEAGSWVSYGESVDFDDPELVELILAYPNGHPVLDDELEEGSRSAALLAERGIKVVVPLVSDEGARAAFILGQKQSGEVYTEQDLRFLQTLSTEMAIALKTCALFDQREQRVRELTALNRLASVLGQDVQLEALLHRALRQVVVVVGADGGSIMLFDSQSEMLTIRAAYGLSAQVVRETRILRGEGIAGWVAKHSKPLLLLDGTGQQFSSELERQGMKSALAVPLVNKEQVIGVLNLSRSHSVLPFSQQSMSVVTSFAAQLAVAIENAQLYSDLEGYFLGTITALAAAVDAKDPYTYGHSSEVTDATLAIAAEMGLDDEQTENLRKAAILHDIGKIGVDSAILNKRGPLDPGEFETIRRHPAIGANILASLDFLGDVVPIVLHHHERFDGGGYPDGIAGQDIPLGARIISVADSFDAMTSDRTYRQALPREAAIQELKDNAGTQFDPDVVAVYLHVLAAQDEERSVGVAPAGAGTGPRHGGRHTR
jgi:putative nucleotidyltransferase with HDIG domain